jgi:glycosyltransferase involved in cell wall biosynthesis
VKDLLVRSRAVRRQAIELIRRERPTDLLATSDDGVFLLGAYHAARATKTDLTVLLLDIYAGNNYSWLKRLVARLYEGRLLRRAKTVIVTNETTRAHYARSYGIDAVVLPHSAASQRIRPYRRAEGQSIVFAGSIYWAQRDAIQDLILALHQLPNARLTLLTDASESEIRHLRGHSTQVEARYVVADEVAESYARADVLFLPLSFGKGGRDVIRTALPGKLPEYLAAGVPVLVHAPADSFIAQDASRQGWGLVVDTPGPSGLVDALRTLFTNDELRRRLVTRAIEVATLRHDERQVAEHFRRLFA